MPHMQPSLRDLGNAELFPALKRRAILGCPFGTQTLGQFNLVASLRMRRFVLRIFLELLFDGVQAFVPIHPA